MTLSSNHSSLLKNLVDNGTLKSKRIISAFKNVKREYFVPARLKDIAYTDEPLPLGAGQTNSQPATVAIMIESLEPKKGQKILEIGAGSGFQSAILSGIVGSKGLIISLEKLPLLYEFGKMNLSKFKNVEYFCADGTKGYPYKAPFDRIIVSADAQKVPDALVKQLVPGGILIIPVKGRALKIQKLDDNIEVKEIGHFNFVPLVGEYE